MLDLALMIGALILFDLAAWRWGVDTTPLGAFARSGGDSWRV